MFGIWNSGNCVGRVNISSLGERSSIKISASLEPPFDGIFSEFNQPHEIINPFVAFCSWASLSVTHDCDIFPLRFDSGPRVHCLIPIY